MTSKTSFFNKAIYKSTVKRLFWGSVLYALLLFLSSGFSVMMTVDGQYAMESAYYYGRYPLVLHSDFLAFPLFLAVVVPTVVALISFRFIHSKRQAVFVHSLPVSRKSNFISTLLADFTLMLIPVVLNTLFLAALSLFSYGAYFSPADCLLWGLYNIYPLFLMFSCAVLAASITGNGVAMAAINILIHSFLVLIAANIGSVAQSFLYGYTSSNAVMDSLSENNFFIRSVNVDNRFTFGSQEATEMLLFSLAALAIYFIAYALYKRRKIESAGNFAGFGCLNAVFKYMISLLVTLIAFGMFSSLMRVSITGFAVLLIIISVIAYTACEMIFKKTAKVLYAWKGYAVFAVLFAAMVVFFANTSFFGYETRIPEREDIAKVGISGSGYVVEGDFLTDDAELIDLALYAHKEIIKDIPDDIFEIIDTYEAIEYMRIEYELKNGKSLKRHYQLPKSKFDRIMQTPDSSEGYAEYRRNY